MNERCRLYLAGVQASYMAVLLAELTSLCLSTTLLVAIYQVSSVFLFIYINFLLLLSLD